ncbi:hypothetical protein FKM82_006253 [Ascaphus truei]
MTSSFPCCTLPSLSRSSLRGMWAEWSFLKKKALHFSPLSRFSTLERKMIRLDSSSKCFCRLSLVSSRSSSTFHPQRLRSCRDCSLRCRPSNSPFLSHARRLPFACRKQRILIFVNSHHSAVLGKQAFSSFHAVYAVLSSSMISSLSSSAQFSFQDPGPGGKPPPRRPWR